MEWVGGWVVVGLGGEVFSLSFLYVGGWVGGGAGGGCLQGACLLGRVAVCCCCGTHPKEGGRGRRWASPRSLPTGASGCCGRTQHTITQEKRREKGTYLEHGLPALLLLLALDVGVQHAGQGGDLAVLLVLVEAVVGEGEVRGEEDHALPGNGRVGGWVGGWVGGLHDVAEQDPSGWEGGNVAWMEKERTPTPQSTHRQTYTGWVGGWMDG